MSELCAGQRVLMGGADALPDQLVGVLLRRSWGSLARAFQTLQCGSMMRLRA